MHDAVGRHRYRHAYRPVLRMGHIALESSRRDGSGECPHVPTHVLDMLSAMPMAKLACRSADVAARSIGSTKSYSDTAGIIDYRRLPWTIVAYHA